LKAATHLQQPYGREKYYESITALLFGMPYLASKRMLCSLDSIITTCTAWLLSSHGIGLRRAKASHLRLHRIPSWRPISTDYAFGVPPIRPFIEPSCCSLRRALSRFLSISQLVVVNYCLTSSVAFEHTRNGTD